MLFIRNNYIYFLRYLYFFYGKVFSHNVDQKEFLALSKSSALSKRLLRLLLKYNIQLPYE